MTSGAISCKALIVLGLVLTLMGCGGPQDPLLKGNLAYRKADLGRAAALYGEALKAPETKVAAHFNLGRVLYDVQNYKTALEHLNAGLAADSEYLLGLYDRGRTEVALDNRKAAEKDFAACTVIDPTFARGWLELAKLHASKGEFSKAVEEISHTLTDLATQEEATLLSARWKTEIDDQAGAVRDLEALLASRPELSKPYFALGAILLDTGDYREAERRFRSGLATQGLQVSGLFGLGQALEGQARTDEATAIYQDILSLQTPESTEPEFALARGRLTSLHENKNVP